MSRHKPAWLLGKAGEPILHDCGREIDLCDFGNCREPIRGFHLGGCDGESQGWLYCEKHLAAEVWKYTNCYICHKRTMPKARGVNLCTTPGCHAATMVL